MFSFCLYHSVNEKQFRKFNLVLIKIIHLWGFIPPLKWWVWYADTDFSQSCMGCLMCMRHTQAPLDEQWLALIRQAGSFRADHFRLGKAHYLHADPHFIIMASLVGGSKKRVAIVGRRNISWHHIVERRTWSSWRDVLTPVVSSSRPDNQWQSQDQYPAPIFSPIYQSPNYPLDYLPFFFF